MIDIHKQIARIYYYETGALHPFFRNGAFEIVEGRNIQKGDSLKAVISEEVAKKNNLGLGDSFELRSFEVPEGVLTLTDWSVTVEIVGIYQVNFFQNRRCIQMKVSWQRISCLWIFIQTAGQKKIRVSGRTNGVHKRDFLRG